MPRVNTIIRTPDAASIKLAAGLLAAGELVALPTETVYGLAGDALNPQAAAAIFQAKERPLFDPLIVHLPDESWLARLVEFATGEQAGIVAKLCRRFWPGPLTIILPRAVRSGSGLAPEPALPDLVTAGGPLVAVRISAHPVFRQVIEEFGGPLAAPSANRFGRISPTCGEDVREELGGRIKLIIEAGCTKHGLESTIVCPDRDGRLSILRHGPITEEDLREIAVILPPAMQEGPARTVTPGALPGHYAPRTPLSLIRGRAGDARNAMPGLKLGLLCFQMPSEGTGGWQAVECLSTKGDLREAAVNLFAALRRLDHAGLHLILVEPVPTVGLGVAIMERLTRAAAGSGGSDGAR